MSLYVKTKGKNVRGFELFWGAWHMFRSYLEKMEGKSFCPYLSDEAAGNLCTGTMRCLAEEYKTIEQIPDWYFNHRQIERSNVNFNTSENCNDRMKDSIFNEFLYHGDKTSYYHIRTQKKDMKFDRPMEHGDLHKMREQLDMLFEKYLNFDNSKLEQLYNFFLKADENVLKTEYKEEIDGKDLFNDEISNEAKRLEMIKDIPEDPKHNNIITALKLWLISKYAIRTHSNLYLT